MSTSAARDWLRQYRMCVLIGYDVLAWVAACSFALLARYDLDTSRVDPRGLLALTAVLITLYIGIGACLRLHQGRARTGSFEEVVLISFVGITTGLVGFTVNFLTDPLWVPRTVPVGATICAVALMGWGRVVWRWTKENDQRVRVADSTPTLIFGAGDGGQQLIHSMLRDPRATWRPVGIIDDDHLKRHLRIEGVPVLGDSSALEGILDERGIHTLVIATPSADSALVRHLAATAGDLGVAVKVLPGVGSMLDSRVGIEDLRDLDVSDLLGRHQIDTDIDSIAGYVTGKRVLVTGAGGSIGSELCRQIHRYGPSELMMLDRDESALHSVQMSIEGRALLDSPNVVLGNIRDERFVQTLFDQRRPEVVFHAAALKHLPMLERYPGEAVKTNVWGTLNLLEAARSARVEKFVNISTDKAANPSSVLGYSKRIAERLTASVASDTDGTFLSVRFGNVLGSRGSVLTSFTSQIEAGGPVTVTHPEVTRYFMTVQEAVQLVVQAAAIGRDGEALVLDMGEPVSIHAVAQQLIQMSGKRVDIEFTGLREGEKMHEELFDDSESDERPRHPLVSHVPVPGIHAEQTRSLDPWTFTPLVCDGLRRQAHRSDDRVPSSTV